MDIPEPVDLAIVAVNRKVVFNVIDDCIRKNVAVAHLYTAGFSETGIACEYSSMSKAK